MSRPRSDIEALKLASSPSNLKKALNIRAVPSTEVLTKRAELENLFADLTGEYERAADDVKIRGAWMEVTKYTAKGAAYEVEIVNPAFRVMSKVASQLATIAKMLAQFDKPQKANVEPGSARALYPDLFKEENLTCPILLMLNWLK
jgi:hypothetical protein